MKLHKLAELFPAIEGEAFDALVTDIKANGLQHPIVTYDDQILDGRNRYNACRKAHVEPRFTPYRGKDPVAYVVSANVARRHLSESQRADAMAALETLSWGQKKTDAVRDANLHLSRPELAKLANVSVRSIATAAAVREAAREKDAPELVRAVQDGKLAVSAAAVIAEAPPKLARQLAVSVLEGEIDGPAAVREVKRAQHVAKVEAIDAVEAKAAAGVYDVVVIDPPWAVQWVDRDCRPNQVGLDYPTMTEAELASMSIPCADDAHVFVWTTHGFLPMALRLLDAWGLSYVCTFVWHKPGGFQVQGLPQYNCEFAVYARKGAPKFVDTRQFFACFEAPRGKHSEKPEAFYETLRRVTAGRRLDMFNRRPIDGFDRWGNEASAAE